jgi:hypothetical protein
MVSFLTLMLLTFGFGSAVAQLAPGVQQSASRTATISGMVTQSDGIPVAGADVHLVGSAVLTTKSDAHGVFDFTSVPYGTYEIVVSTTTLGTFSRKNIAVAGDLTIAIQYVASGNVGNLKTIAHVSTRSSGAQINVTSASIASINPSEYAVQGNASWKELLDRIPGVTVGGNLSGGLSTSVVIPDGPFQPITLSINGALPYETSVTLDGMPLISNSYLASPGSGSDLSFLPMPMFETVDIVRGPGADAPSIVDSIGGSFVLHAPGQVEKSSFQLSASNDPYGGIISNAKVALKLGKLSATIVYGANDSPGPLGSQSVINAITSTPATVNGQPFLSGGFTGYPPNVNATYLNCNCIYQNSLLYDGVPVNTAWTQHSGALALAYSVTPSITAQLFYAGASSKSLQTGAEYPVDFIPSPGYTGSITPGMHSYIDAPSSTTAQGSSLLEEKITAYVGRGVLRVAALQNNSYNQLSYPNIEPNGQYTLYGTGRYTAAPGTAVNFNGTPAYLTFTPFALSERYWVNNRDLLASYAIQIGSTSSVGISYVTSYYNYPFEQSEMYGGFVFPPLNTPSAVSETTNEVRLNATTQLSEKLSLNGSWYFSRGSYHVQNPSDASGNTYVDSVFPYNAPRIAGVWRPSLDIAIRAAAGGGYALPALSNLIGTNVPSCFLGTCTVTVPNLNLEPEKSFGFDVGTDMRLHRDTVVSLDFYRTNLYGQFFESTQLSACSVTICGGDPL